MRTVVSHLVALMLVSLSGSAGLTITVGELTVTRNSDGSVTVAYPVSGTAESAVSTGTMGSVRNPCGSVSSLTTMSRSLAIATFVTLRQPSNGQWSGKCSVTIPRDKALDGTYTLDQVSIFDATQRSASARSVRFQVSGPNAPRCSDTEVLIHHRCVDQAATTPTLASSQFSVVKNPDGSNTAQRTISGTSYYGAPASLCDGLSTPQASGCRIVTSTTDVKAPTDRDVNWSYTCNHRIPGTCASGRYQASAFPNKIGPYDLTVPQRSVMITNPNAIPLPTIVVGPVTSTRNADGSVTVSLALSGTSAAALVSYQQGSVRNVCATMYSATPGPRSLTGSLSFPSVPAVIDGRWSGTCSVRLAAANAPPGTYSLEQIAVGDANGSRAGAEEMRVTIR